ncbi:VWA domain-containing protein [Planctomycetes bacterium K23_9]|uniref:VWFA domain-containing protein n=1 Tax=Stieleria marina TaxID=1930275 RepID=A0A517NTG6_9BACT|nr:hypothetical protein K239x_23680 [Planctomycetes bacterium K23_9]
MRPVATFSLIQRRGKQLVACCAIAVFSSSFAPAADSGQSDGANVRIASYQTPSGDVFFASSIQPSADDSLLNAARKAPADVVIVVDTSASQVGDYRRESVAAIRGVLDRLRSTDRVRVFAADVQATPLGNSFDSAKSDLTNAAINQLKQRLPLGNTNMVTVIDSVRAALVSQSEDHTRSIIYIGDGSSIDSTSNEDRFGGLVEALRSDRIAVHSIAVGPSTNIELMAILANQTGGVLGVVGNDDDSSAAAVARSVGTSSTMSPIWLTGAKLLPGMTTVHGSQMPPLRLDRDSIVLGTADAKQRSGQFILSGETTSSKIRIVADANIEPSHMDFAFLPGLIKDASKNRGLTLATANSTLLRETARLRAVASEDLVRAGRLALQEGNKRGARAVAQLALEADPNNPEAQSLEKISGNRLVMQNPADSPFDDIFGGASAPAADAGGAMDAGGADPFGGAAADPAPAAGGGPFGGPGDATPAPAADDVFGGGGDAMAPSAPAANDDVFGAPANDAAGMDDAAATGFPPATAPVTPDVFDSAPPAAPQADFPAAPLNTAPPVAPAPSMMPVTPLVGDDEILERGGDLLDRVVQQRSLVEGRLRGEVRQQIRWAQRMLGSNPVGVGQKLKALLSRIETTPDIDPQLREEMQSQLRTAIQIAGRREAEYQEEQFNLQQQISGSQAASRLLADTFRREATLKTLSQQMNALIAEGRYTEADGQVSLELARIAGDTITNDSVAGRHFTDFPLSLQTYARDRRYREMRERNFVDAFSLVMKANIPFVDEPPVHYPDADVWQRLSRRRLREYGSIELVGDNATERRIQASLGDETSQTFVETPLEEAVASISRMHDIPIVVDRKALEEIGLTPDTPVNVDLKNVSLRSFMRLMLRELDLTYMIKDEVMQITTAEAAEANLINKVYPVGDLVVPILQLGGGGGGGGMGGGGMGGGGGGMGGGGMGGGGMGGGGMGGGGAFAVPDDISLRNKPRAKQNSATATSAASPKKAKTMRAAVNVAAIRIKPTAGQSKSEAWNEFFANEKITSAEELTILDQRVRTTVREFSIKAANAQEAGNTGESVAHFADARDVVAAAIRAGHVQPWMYQAYAIALSATDAPKVDVERALLSAVDFAETPEEVLHVAARLEDLKSYAAALRLCRNVADMEPYRREPYVMGLRIAQEIDDVDGLTWACKGVLSQAWPKKYQVIVDQAKLVARATYQQLIEDGRKEDADKFNRELKLAASHDVIIRVRWAGDADIDVAVEEPSGTVCSLENALTESGGTLLGDSFPGSGEDETGAVSETYICPKGFTGTYRLLLRRVWGNVSTGKATVEILTDLGRPTERFIQKQVPLTERDALLVFEVKDGQRKQEIAHAQLDHLRDVQANVREDLLGQVAGGIGGNFGGFDRPNQAEVLQELYRDVQNLTGGTGAVPGGLLGVGGFQRRGAVGFQPQITQLPEGASVTGLAIISADRRYVRISPAPFFSQVGDVTTFNFVDGTGGAAGGGAAAAGGGAAGGAAGGAGIGN